MQWIVTFRLQQRQDRRYTFFCLLSHARVLPGYCNFLIACECFGALLSTVNCGKQTPFGGISWVFCCHSPRTRGIPIDYIQRCVCAFPSKESCYPVNSIFWIPNGLSYLKCKIRCVFVFCSFFFLLFLTFVFLQNCLI